MILIDTDICIELLKGNRTVIAHRQGVDDVVAISFMTIGELFYGAEKSSDKAKNKALVESFLITVEIVHTDLPIMTKFGELKGFLESKGQRLADADLLIAATSLVTCKYLVSGNTAHFARFPELQVVNWIR